MSDSVFDASAPLAVIRNEPGAEVVLRALGVGRAFISTVNVVEVLSILNDRGMSYEDSVYALAELELIAVPLAETTARRAASIRPGTRALGLGLADRVCLALGIEMALPVFTGDRAWSRADLPIQLKFIRP